MPPLPARVGLSLLLSAVASTQQVPRALWDAAARIGPGVALVALERQGGTVTLTLGGTAAARAAAGHGLEQGIDGLQRLALDRSGAQRVVLLLRAPDGTVSGLDDFLARHRPPVVRGPGPAAPEGPASGGALAGRTIALSAGHGYYWHSSWGWITQRPTLGGLTEDLHTNEIAIRWLIPALENLGARVLACRERSETTHEAIADNDAGPPAYVETGSWSTSSFLGWRNGTYRWASSAPVESATAEWRVPVARDGVAPVYVFFRAGTNRAPDARYRIHHTGGVAEVVVDQRRHDRTWLHLGDHAFGAADGARIGLSNQSAAGGVVIADAVRVGGGRGSVVRGGRTSGRPRWQEAARYWARFAGAPPSVYDPIAGGEDNDDDVTARPRYAEWRGADAFLSLHTNAGGGTGTSSFIHSTSPTAGSATLRQRVHDRLVADIRARYDPGWTDRGKKSANFGELRLLATMPGVLLEVAFHDQPGSRDHDALHDPVFRRIAAEAIARGVLEYFAPGAPWPPQPPGDLRVTQDGARGLRVAWSSVAGVTGYTVEVSPDGVGFETAAQVTGTSWSTGPLPHHAMRSFRVRAVNASGRSFPTEVLTAGTDHTGAARVLLVQGFDRLGRTVKGPENTGDYLRLHGDALRRAAGFSVGFDAASNDAVRRGTTTLGSYRVVDWACGEESTRHETFDAVEQGLVQAYLAGGGRLLVSGSEIGWDLDARGSSIDRAFYRNVLGARYVADDAGTYAFGPGLNGTLAQGVPGGTFDDGSHGTYDVDWPDVIAPADTASRLFLRYAPGLQGAGIERDTGTGRVVNLGFPLETVVDPATRALLARRALRFLLDPLPLEGPEDAPAGSTFPLDLELPGEAGMPYLLAASHAIHPPIALPGGGVLPLADGPLISAGWAPNPWFTGFQGTLDGAGRARASVAVPALPGLRGVEVFFCGVTLQPGGGVNVRALSNWLRVTVR